MFIVLCSLTLGNFHDRGLFSLIQTEFSEPRTAQYRIVAQMGTCGPSKPGVLGLGHCGDPGKREGAQAPTVFTLMTLYIPSASCEKFRQTSSFSSY